MNKVTLPKPPKKHQNPTKLRIKSQEKSAKTAKKIKQKISKTSKLNFLMLNFLGN